MFPNIPPAVPIGLDFETNALPYWHPDFRVIGVGVALPGQEWYFDLRTTPNVVRWLADVLPNRLIVAQFAQYDLQCVRVLGIDPRRMSWYCTMTAACLIDEHQFEYNLSAVCIQSGVTSQKTTHLDAICAAIGCGTHDEARRRLTEAPPHLVAAYGAGDARDALEVYLAQQAEIEKQELQKVVELECELIPVLAEMSWGGVRVDLEAAHAAIPALDESELVLQREIDEIVGRSFNVNSTPQIRAFFQPEAVSKFQWRLIDGTFVGPTKKGGGPSLGQDTLRQIQHPIAAKILALRKTIKLRDTFIRGHVIGSADGEGYVHTQFNQTRNDENAGTVTGRLSSTDPALQQITKRDKRNAEILRSMFLADESEQWLCMDYSQVDFRCGAHLQNDLSVIQAYQDDPMLDYHQVISDMTGIPRNPPYAGAPNTKQINLGLSFGAGAGKLAFMMGMPYTVKEYKAKMSYQPGTEAQGIFDLYHKKLPAVKTFMKKAENVARETQFVRTQIGRRLRFPRGVGAHKAAGLLYQAYAADIHKIGLVSVDRAIREHKLPARLMMSCHDEIGVSTKENEEVKNIILKEYTDFGSPQSRVKMRVPIMASAEYGPNWYVASK